MGNNLFSLGGLTVYLPSASPRAITIKPPLLHRLFPNKYLPDYDYFYIRETSKDTESKNDNISNILKLNIYLLSNYQRMKKIPMQDWLLMILPLLFIKCQIEKKTSQILSTFMQEWIY